jgi:hypothetical protein
MKGSLQYAAGDTSAGNIEIGKQRLLDVCFQGVCRPQSALKALFLNQVQLLGYWFFGSPGRIRTSDQPVSGQFVGPCCRFVLNSTIAVSRLAAET